ncbi:MAG: hypothetical protein V1702_05695 [Candidatus Woesearchaeota archaeon]
MVVKIIRGGAQEKKVKACIAKYGYFAEHNYFYYMLLDNDPGENCFFSVDGKYGMLGQYVRKNKEWVFVTGILAPKSKRLGVFMSVLEYCLKHGKKFTIEADDEFFNEALRAVWGSKSYRALIPRFVLYWPVFDMKKWEGHKMKGKSWKKMRNILNGFYKSHDVKVVDSAKIPKNQLLKIVSEWTKKRHLMSYGCNRKDSNQAYYQKYVNLVNSGFRGMMFAKTLVVDGIPSTITCGWKIPHSKGYYSAVGIYNYAFKGLGEASNMDDLKRLKKAGFQYVDFGGSPKPLLEFKKKFRYDFTYRTRTFSIVKK